MTSPAGKPATIVQKAKRKISLPWFRQGSVAPPHPGIVRQHTIDTPGSFQSRLLRRQPSLSQVHTHTLSLSYPTHFLGRSIASKKNQAKRPNFSNTTTIFILFSFRFVRNLFWAFARQIREEILTLSIKTLTSLLQSQ